MLLGRLSIQWRITLLSSFCLLGIVTVLVVTSLQQMSDKSTRLKERNTALLEEAAKQRLQAETQVQALEFRRYVLASQYTGLELARQSLQMRRLAQSQGWDAAQLRGALTDLVRDNLTSNAQLLSLYLVFEPDALDAQDAAFAGQDALGSNEKGRFASYWAQASGQPSGMAVSEALINDTTPGPDGSPFKTWFDCPKTTRKPCLLSPYIDDTSGQRTMITTLSFPLLVDGKVIGVAGLDINLDNLQQLVSNSSRALYDGAASISILSHSGLFAGNSSDASQLGKLTTDSALLERLREGQAQIDTQDGNLRVFTPLRPIPDAAPWAVLLSVPMTAVLKPALQLHKELDTQNANDVWHTLLYGLLASAVGLVMVWLTARGVVRPIRGVAAMLKDIASGGGDLTRRLEYAQHDELGELSDWFNRFLDRLQPLIGDLQHLVRDAREDADRSAIIASRISDGMQQQYQEIDQVATASQEMSATAHDVAHNAAQAAEATHGAEQATREGLTVIGKTTASIDALAQAITVAVHQVEGLALSSEKIGSVLEVIRSISEQTNLLALNAAIEAARAGEAGRGFAVVADEVRNLARHTRDSIEEIRQVIERLQANTHEVVEAMQDGAEQAKAGVQQVSQASAALNKIGEAVSVITDMNLQIASAAEQQSAVAEEVSRNVSVIRTVSEGLSTQVEEARQVSQNLNEQAQRQHQLAEQFRV